MRGDIWIEVLTFPVTWHILFNVRKLQFNKFRGSNCLNIRNQRRHYRARALGVGDMKMLCETLQLRLIIVGSFCSFEREMKCNTCI